jgi:uncharacterized protein YfaP (DUF2135 family)
VPLDSRLVRNLESDLRIVMTWDSDNTDMDLHVIEPSGEECDYSHNRTAIGGRMSDDFTQGYGPEEYFVRRNKAGKYEIRTNYFASREQKITGGTTVQATVYTDWGSPDREATVPLAPPDERQRNRHHRRSNRREEELTAKTPRPPR